MESKTTPSRNYSELSHVSSAVKQGYLINFNVTRLKDGLKSLVM